ncbi:hypothetical protein CEXT_89501 [Caerostris extrusa]|uniref:Uncharacterized protein n=1 Tax=Caerostris extrusa TaxID=172846 RepID=A0AAV4MNM9_CAEEX|nr:hypothetical protein CEXT_89501 [Caerostris extrusa]
MINGCRFTRHSEINSADIGKHHYKSHTEHNLNKSLKKSKRKFIYPKTFSLSQGKLLQSKLSSKTSDKFLSKISSKPKEKQLQHKLSVKPQENRIQNVLQEKLPCVISSEPDEKISILKVPSEPRKKISSKMPAKHRQKFMRFKSEERQLRQKPSVKPEEKLPLNDSQGKLSLCAISPELEKKN